MYYRDRVFLLFLSLLCSFSLASDKPNADVIAQQTGGKIVSTIPSTGDSVSYTPTNTGTTPIYEGQTQTSQPRPTDNGPTNSSAGGFFGFLYNLGRKSEKDRRLEDTRNGIDKALSKAQAGIPLTSEDYAALGTADLSKVRTTVNTPKPSTAPAIRAPEIETPSVPAVMGGKQGITCIPQYPYGSSIATISPDLSKKLLPISPSKEPTLLPESPLKRLDNTNPGSGVGGGLTLIGGAGALATKAAAPAVAGEAAAGGAAGATAAGGTGMMSWFTSTVLPPVAMGVAAVGIAAGIYAVLDYVTPNERNIFFKDRYQAKLRNKAITNKVQVPSQGGSSTPSPKKPDDEKEKRAKQIQEYRRWTNKEAREQAKALNKGYVEKKDKPESMKTIGFTNGKDWITPDMNGHNGGVWKLYDLKGKRIATLDKNLNRIKN